MKKVLITTVTIAMTGNKYLARLYEFACLNTKVLITKNKANAKAPETIGESNHEQTIAATPLTYGNSSTFFDQMTHF